MGSQNKVPIQIVWAVKFFGYVLVCGENGWHISLSNKIVNLDLIRQLSSGNKNSTNLP